jgi:hypothetical protein
LIKEIGEHGRSVGFGIPSATQLKLWFARRREDGFEVPCAPEHPPTRVLC